MHDLAESALRRGYMDSRVRQEQSGAANPADGTIPASVSNAPPVSARLLERALGSRIRQLRRDLDLSMADLAGASGISTGMMSKIENGQISPSLATLQSISSALQVSLSALFASFEDREDCSYVPSGQGVTIERRGSKVGHVYQLLGHVMGGDIAVEPYLITLREKSTPFTGFQHSGLEFIYMLEGEVSYRHGSALYHLRPGDSLLFDSTALHGPETILTETTRYLSIIIYPGR
jgi:transcriptional regulator with XRE-family HTH domain